MASAAGSSAAVPFWRAAGMTYITYSNICASLVRNCLKEPYKTEALTREKVHFAVSKWADGKPQKPYCCGGFMKRHVVLMNLVMKPCPPVVDLVAPKLIL